MIEPPNVYSVMCPDCGTFLDVPIAYHREGDQLIAEIDLAAYLVAHAAVCWRAGL